MEGRLRVLFRRRLSPVLDGALSRSVRNASRHGGMFVRGSATNRLLVTGLSAITLIVVARSLLELLTSFPMGADIEIPLRAADRWAHGGEP